MRIDEYDYGILQRAYEITGLQNEIMMTNKDNLEGMITTDALINLLEAMIDEYEHKREELQDLENREKDEYEYDPYDMLKDHEEGII